MSPKTMRVLIVNVCVLLVAFSVIHAEQSGSISPRSAVVSTLSPVSCQSSNFLGHRKPGKDSNGKVFLDLMKDHFDLSMKYLLTGKQYGSQYVQRPGMAKYLDEASTRQWEEGMDVLKKFLQRGGSTSTDFKSAFQIEGKPQLTLETSEVMSTKYVDTLKFLLGDSKTMARDMNHLHHLGGKNYDNGGDAEIAHYLDEKLAKEAELTREFAGHVNTLQTMRGLGVALNMFDSNL